MISKERLEEIIKNKGVVWVYSTYSKPYRILPITFDGEREIDSHTFCLNWNVKNIFETKEDAEFYVEFSCIERTERLELPTWEEMQDKFEKKQIVEKYYYYSKHFYKPNRDVNNIDNTYSMYLMPSGFIIIDDNENVITLFRKPLTKENYTLACRKAKELFLGTEDEK